MKASRLKDKPVVSMADGAQVGTVKELLFDTSDLRLTALLLRADSGESTLPFGSIRSVGSDAVMIESAADTAGAHGQAALDTTRSLEDLMDLSAVNVEGTLLGKVKELEIGDQDGRLTKLEVHRGGVLGIGGTTVTVPPSAIRSIGAKLITVDMSAEEGQKQPSS
jgi:sporulation protein YlmC with PRC-barrel domain